jgi:general secretion pathway protein L
MVREFLNWWAAQLLGLIPDWFTGLQERWRNRLIAELQADPAAHGMILTLQRHSRTMVLGCFGLNETGIGAMRAALARQACPPTVVLRLPPGMLLEQRIALPVASEWNIGRILFHEINRITPFAEADLFWTWSTERRNDALGRLQIRLSLVPKAAVSAAISALRQAGAPLSMLEAPGPNGPPRLLPFRDSRARGGGWRGEGWRGRAFPLAFGACVMLAGTAVAIPFADQSLAAQRCEDRMASLRPGMQEVEALRQRITNAEAGNEILSTLRHRVGNTLGMLAILTRMLPDDTHLRELTLHGGVATFAGQSAAAARLIATLSSDPAIRDPAFTAPITRSELSGNVESFSLRLDFGQ